MEANKNREFGKNHHWRLARGIPRPVLKGIDWDLLTNEDCKLAIEAGEAGTRICFDTIAKILLRCESDRKEAVAKEAAEATAKEAVAREAAAKRVTVLYVLFFVSLFVGMLFT